MIRTRLVAAGMTALAASLIVSLVPTGAGLQAAVAAEPTRRQIEAAYERGTMSETNRFRRIHHRPKVRHHRCLNRKAEVWAHKIATHRVGFRHQALRPVLRQCRTQLAAENLAMQHWRLATRTSAVRALMRSPGHRRNILDRRATHLGVATAWDNARDAYVTVQVFGRFPGLDRRQDAAERRRQTQRLSRRLEQRVQADINHERRRRRRGRVTHNRVLNRKAETWARKIASHRVGTRHQNLLAVRRAARARGVGENIVRIGGRFVSPARVVDRMMRQRANRRRLLNPRFTDVGVAAGWDHRRRQWVVVQVFANRPRRG